MEYALSVPFKAKAEETVVKIKDIITASDLPIKNISLKNWKTWFMLLGIVAVIYVMFWKSNEVVVPSQEPPVPVELLQQAHPLDIANKHYGLLNSSSGQERLYHYQICTRNYEQSLKEMNPSQPEYPKLCFRLAQLFQRGISEYYDDLRDEKIPGIPPDTERAITYYQIAIENGYHSAILDLASIFHWGNVSFKPNRDYAKHLYGVVLKIGTEYEQGVARDRLRQMQEEEGQTVGSVMDGLDGVGNNFSSGTFNPTIYTEEFSSVNGGSLIGDSEGGSAIQNSELTKGIDENYVKELMHSDLRLKSNRIDKQREKSNIITDDPRNASDHMVCTTAKQSLESLKGATNIQYDMPTTLKMIHTYIVQDCDIGDNRKQDAIKVLSYFASNISKLGFDQAKELEALHIVYNRIQSSIHDKKQRKTLMDNLVRELSECIEYGELVCSEGRINRIIDTLNGVDPMVQIKPKWALTQEMMNKCALLRKKMLEKEQSETVDAFEAQSPTARQRLLVRNFQKRLKSEIERDFIRTYVDSGIMTKDMLQTEMNKWIDSI